MTSFKTFCLAMAVAAVAICTQAEGQIYYPQQYYPAQPQYVPVYPAQPVQQPINQQPIGDFQGQVQPYSGVPFDPNDPSTFYGETSETEAEATDQRPWDPSQGHLNDDTVISIEEPAEKGMVIFRYPVDATGALNYTVNGQKGTLAPGTNLKVPSGEDFKFAFVPAEGKEAIAHDIMSDGSFIFKATDAGWKVVDYLPPQEDPMVQKAMAEKAAADKKAAEMRKAEAEKKEAARMKEMEEKKAAMEMKAAEDKKAAMEKAAAEKAAVEKQAAEANAATQKALDEKAAERKAARQKAAAERRRAKKAEAEDAAGEAGAVEKAADMVKEAKGSGSK